MVLSSLCYEDDYHSFTLLVKLHVLAASIVNAYARAHCRRSVDA